MACNEIPLQGQAVAARLRRAVKNIYALRKYFLKSVTNNFSQSVRFFRKIRFKKIEISKNMFSQKKFFFKSCQKILRFLEYLSSEKTRILAKKFLTSDQKNRTKLI